MKLSTKMALDVRNVIILYIINLVASMEISTEYGAIRGERMNSPTRNLPPIVQYLGVPTGSAPLGDIRFGIPRNAARWTHATKDATVAGNVCMQKVPQLSDRERMLDKMPRYVYNFLQRLEPWIHESQQSENCLNMNIYAPITSGNQQQPLKVLVIIHGPSFDYNAANPYNASVLASYGDLIVVTINYRLGVFGFLASCDTFCDDCKASCSGNWALFDITNALTTLKSILPAMGGDPNAITLLGWKSGAVLANLLMTSPLSAPQGVDHRLFQRAILIGGSALSPWALVGNPSQYFYQLAVKLGCNVYENEEKKKPASTAKVLECIREQSTEKIQKASDAIEAPSFLTAFGPVVDGTSVINYPQQMMAKPNHRLYQDIDLMVGLSSNEGFDMLSDKFVDLGVEEKEKEKIFRTLTRNLFNYHRQEILAAIKNEYTDWTIPRSTNLTQNRDDVMHAVGDAMYVAPTIHAAQMHARDQALRSAHKKNTYAYVFTHETASNVRRASPNRVKGALPNDDIAYILGYPTWDEKGESPYGEYDSNDRVISMLMMRYISNFVKSGDPSRPQPITGEFGIPRKFAQLYWSEFSEENREAYLEISRNAEIKHYYRADKVAFWNRLLPSLHNAGRDLKLSDEHHTFPGDHFDAATYWGRVRPYDEFANYPFPPPPSPPPAPLTPPPKEKKDHSSNTGIKVTNISDDVAGTYSSILGLTVGIGCALLVLNILIFAGIYHQRDKQRRSKKKLLMAQQQAQHNMQLHYHTPMGDGQHLNAQGLPMLTTTTIVPPPPPAPIVRRFEGNYGENNNTISRHHVHHQPSVYSASQTPTMPSNPANNMQRNANEFDPLLQHRPGVSPTCPRHGRAALQAMHQQPQQVDEIQV